MDLIKDLLTEHSQISLPIWFAIIFYGAFSALDLHLARDIKTRFSAYLLSGGYEAHTDRLALIIQNVFDQIFGPRHLTWKCFGRSTLFSTGALLALLGFTFLYDPKGSMAILRLNVRNEFAETITIWLFLMWAFWCVIPDYLSLLKSRYVILWLSSKPIGLLLGLAIIAVDFSAGTVLFLLVFAFAQSVAAIAFGWWTGKLPLYQHATSDLSTAVASVAFLVVMIALVEAIALIPHADLYRIVPYGDLFWASMWPSAWLWSYVLMAILTSYLVKSFPLLRRVLRFVDLEDHPFRSLGFVGGVVLFVFGYLAYAVNLEWQRL
jgi:hypothetical protein